MFPSAFSPGLWLYRVLLLVSCMLCTTLTEAEAQQQPRSYSLLIGIAKYQHVRPQLKWPTKDVERLRDVLPLYGFSRQPQSMQVLTNEQATKVAILKKMEWLQRVAQPGDRVLFYFAGHGSKVFDESGDERDRTDETLVPFDATTKGQSHILDDRIYRWTQGFRTHKVVFLFDSCFSGGAFRGLRNFRDPHLKRSGSRYWPNPTLIPKLRRWHILQRKHQRSAMLARKIAVLPRSERYILLSASRSYELSWENHALQGGVFTLLLVRALRRYYPRMIRQQKRVTFRDLFHAIRQGFQQGIFARYQNLQHPTLVGAASQSLFFLQPQRHKPGKKTTVCAKGVRPLCVTMWINNGKGRRGRAQRSFRVGESFYVYLRANQPCRVEIWVHSSKGMIQKKYPDPVFHPAYKDGIQAGKLYRWPPLRNSVYQFQVSGPVGVETIQVVAMSRRFHKHRRSQLARKKKQRQRYFRGQARIPLHHRGGFVVEEGDLPSTSQPLRAAVSFVVRR